MNVSRESRRSFIKTSVALAGTASLMESIVRAESDGDAEPLLAYVGTFSSPLRDVLPTQVDLPPGNGRGIHLFQVNRDTGAMTAADVHEMGTSPSCLALNAAGTRLYSANETDRVGEKKEGTVSAFAVDPDHRETEAAQHRPLRRRRPHLREHPPVRCGSRWWPTTSGVPSRCCRSLKTAGSAPPPTSRPTTGKVGPTRATNAPKGSFAFSGHDRTHAHMIQADPSGRFVLHVDLGLDKIFFWKFDEKKGALAPNDPASVSLPAGDGPRHFHFHPNGKWLYSIQEEGSTVVLFDCDADTGRLASRQTISTLPRDSLGAISAPAFWSRPTAASSMPATGCTTPSGSLQWAQTAT